MSQKDIIEEMLKADKGYDEIEDQTGSARSYIRSIAVQYRKRAAEVKTPESPETKTITPESPERKETSGMNFIDDGDHKEKTPEQKTTGDKTGGDYHKAWIKAAKYECGACGCVVGRTTKYCPHCGQTLQWEGIE